MGFYLNVLATGGTKSGTIIRLQFMYGVTVPSTGETAVLLLYGVRLTKLYTIETLSQAISLTIKVLKVICVCERSIKSEIENMLLVCVCGCKKKKVCGSAWIEKERTEVWKQQVHLCLCECVSAVLSGPF